MLHPPASPMPCIGWVGFLAWLVLGDGRIATEKMKLLWRNAHSRAAPPSSIQAASSTAARQAGNRPGQSVGVAPAGSKNHRARQISWFFSGRIM